MTVAELMAKLKPMPPDAKVYFETYHSMDVEDVAWDAEQKVVWLRDE